MKKPQHTTQQYTWQQGRQFRIEIQEECVWQKVVLYNGDAACPKHTVQYLSQSFMVQDEEPVLELKVDVYNINYEEHSELLQKSRHLTDYSLFIHHVNEGRAAGKELEYVLTVLSGASMVSEPESVEYKAEKK